MADHIRNLAKDPPRENKERRELYEAARALSMALETPFDAMHRLFWTVRKTYLPYHNHMLIVHLDRATPYGTNRR